MGVKVYMYFFDHLPPHVHIIGRGFRAALSIPEGSILAGNLPPRLRAIAETWVRQEAQALMQNWERAQIGKPLLRANPPQ
ncbi:MAG: DUF4160 domain-containing protein [Anaerolineae bacterium]